MSDSIVPSIDFRTRLYEAELKNIHLEAELAHAKAATVQWFKYDGTTATLPDPINLGSGLIN